MMRLPAVPPSHRQPRLAGLRQRREPEPADPAAQDLPEDPPASASEFPPEDPPEDEPDLVPPVATIDLRENGLVDLGAVFSDAPRRRLAGAADSGEDWAAAAVQAPVRDVPAAVGPVAPVAAPATEWLELQDAIEMLQRAHDGLLPSAPLRSVLDDLVARLAAGSRGDVALLRGDDDDGWHVVAGSGLRTLEVRPLGALPPLLGRLDAACPILTVAETDTVRGDLAGLPLSRHHSLLVLRHPQDLVTVLGRGEPFDRDDVDGVTRELAEALPALRRGWRTEALLLGLVDWFEGEPPVR